MITSLVVKNAVDAFSSSVALDTIDGNGVGYPLTLFDWHPNMDGATQPRMQRPGQWPWRKDSRSMTITAEGRILARTTTEYWTQRKALLAKCLHAPNNVDPEPIKFELVLDGDGTTYSAFCVLESVAEALDVNATHSPTVSEFQLIYTCNAGYWSNGTTLVNI